MSTEPPQPTRVLVADPQPLFRDGLVGAIDAQPEFEVVCALDDGDRALAAISRLRPDVVVIDVAMAALGRPDGLAALTSDGAPPHVVLLSAQLDSESVHEGLAGGARGYLSKDADGDQVCSAIAAVARGEMVLAPVAQSALADEIRRGGARSAAQLTQRELDVLRLVAEGLSAPQIGERLHLSAATVKTHLGTLYEKLGVPERAAAVAEAMRRGLLE